MGNEQLREAIKALQSGDKREARRLLGIVLRSEPDNVPAWWYLAEALDDPEQKSHCLRQVLRLHPNHAEARRKLGEIERRSVRVTPPDGLVRPVFEAEDRGGRLIVPGADEGYLPITKGHPNRSSVVPFAVVVAASVALVMLLGAIVFFRSGILQNWPGVREPEAPATPRLLVFDVQYCTTDGQSGTTLEFINNAEVTLEVLQGQPGQEVHLLTLGPGEQASVDVEPGLQLRYAAHTDAPGYAGGGAIIEVPEGGNCQVPIE